MHNALYRIGRPRSTADIAGLWQQVFADSEAFLVDYFGRLYNPDLSPCIYTGSRLDASLQLIPFRLCAGGRTLDVLYVYAVMTRPEARGRGMMRSLLDWAHQAAQRRRCAGTLLVAADAQLASAYEHRGYIRAMHLTHARIDSLQGLDDVSFCAGHRMGPAADLRLPGRPWTALPAPPAGMICHGPFLLARHQAPRYFLRVAMPPRICRWALLISRTSLTCRYSARLN